MSNVVKFANAGLPAVAAASTAAALRQMATNIGGGAEAILKMDKTGHWVFGAEQTETEPDAQWAVNPFSFVHGFIAWGEGEVLGEKMVPVTAPLPELDAAPAGSKRGWEAQVGMHLKCMSGEDEGTEVRFSTTSVGGKKAVQALAVAIATQVDKDPTKPVPVVALKKDHYTHKSYGKVYTPVLDVVKWIGMDGEDTAPAEAELAAEPAAEQEAPRRRRRVVS
jgi:hypothetical protein